MSEHQPVTSSSSIKSKQSDVRFTREILAPENHPRVRWHSTLYVTISRYIGEFLLYGTPILVFFLIGPSLISWMYPDVIVPFAKRLEWKCEPLKSYKRIPSLDMVLKTNLLAATSALQIQIYSKNNVTKLDDLERIWVVIDDCTFDHYGDDLVICRPFTNSGPHLNFMEYMLMAETCYHYIRQMTRKAKIIGYGKGITANALLAAASKLKRDSCSLFEKIYVENPISSIYDEFDNSLFGMAYLLPGCREKVIKDAITEHGLHRASFEKNVELLTDISIVVITDDASKFHDQVKPSVKFGTIKDIVTEMDATPPTTTPRPFTFRHPNEKECAKKWKKPMTPLLVF